MMEKEIELVAKKTAILHFAFMLIQFDNKIPHEEYSSLFPSL
jgi:hypothetical protein